MINERPLLADGAKLCPDGLWRWGGVGEPIGWTDTPAVVIVHPDGHEERISESVVVSSNVKIRQL